jgi:hypothetical protein
VTTPSVDATPPALCRNVTAYVSLPTSGALLHSESDDVESSPNSVEFASSHCRAAVVASGAAMPLATYPPYLTTEAGAPSVFHSTFAPRASAAAS